MIRTVSLSVLSAAVAVWGFVGCENAVDNGPGGNQGPPGGDPPRIECGSAALHQDDHGVCDAMDATGEGSCLCLLGYAWSGSSCEMLGGCECVGEDCEKLTETAEECEAAHADCGSPPPIPCGSAALYAGEHDVCEAMDATGQGDCECILGYAWDGSECVFLGGCECAGDDCDELSETLEECQAVHQGCVESGQRIECGSLELYAAAHDICEPMDIALEGQCYCASMGWVWNGTACEELPAGYCECVGDDCDKIAETREECEADHAECLQGSGKTIPCGSPQLFVFPHDECAAMDATAEGACYCLLGYAWTGSECAMLGGCECVGADCDRLTETIEECEAAHAGCS